MFLLNTYLIHVCFTNLKVCSNPYPKCKQERNCTVVIPALAESDLFCCTFLLWSHNVLARQNMQILFKLNRQNAPLTAIEHTEPTESITGVLCHKSQRPFNT